MAKGMKHTGAILGIIFAQSACGQYQLQALPNTVLENERETQRAFTEWRRQDAPLLKDVLGKPPEEAQRLVSQAAQAAQQYTAAQAQYFRSLQADVQHDIAEFQSRGGGATSGSIDARRNQITKQLIELLDEDKRIESEISKVSESPDIGRASALTGILETERETIRQQRDNLTLQLKRLDGMTTSDASLRQSSRELVGRFQELDHLYEDQVAYSQKLSKALDGYYLSLRSYVEARAKKVVSQIPSGTTGPSPVAASGISGTWEYVRPGNSPATDKAPARIRLEVQEQSGNMLSADLTYWVKGASSETHPPDAKWHFVGKLIAMSQSFDFSTSNGERGEITLDTGIPGSLGVSWIVNVSTSNKAKHGPFALGKIQSKSPASGSDNKIAPSRSGESKALPPDHTKSPGR